MKKIKKHMLLLSMSVITILAAGAVFSTLRVFQAQEAALDSMMRSYVLDLADSVSDRLDSSGRGMGRGRMTRFRMLSMSPILPDGDAGGVLVLTGKGMVLTASAGAEKLIPLWKKGVPIDEPRTVQDADGRQFCVVAKRTGNAGDGVFVLAAVSRTYLLGPMLGIRRLWFVLAILSSAAVFAGMLGLWKYLVAPLHRVVENVRNMKWGRDRLPLPERPGFCEVEALSNAISELAGEAVAREELRAQYVSDIVRVQEDSRKRLARDLHDSPLQGVIAAIKRIQLARGDAALSGSENLEMAEEVAQDAAREIRDFCDELSPSWVKLGLSSAMYENADRLSRTFGVEVDLRGAEEAEAELNVSEEHVLAFVRVLQEAVSNSARHGNAARVEVSFQKAEKKDGADGPVLLFKIKDNGSGMAAGDTDYESLRATGHRGLAHIHERVQLLKGTMRLAADSGLLIEIEVPV